MGTLPSPGHDGQRSLIWWQNPTDASVDLCTASVIPLTTVSLWQDFLLRSFPHPFCLSPPYLSPDSAAMLLLLAVSLPLSWAQTLPETMWLVLRDLEGNTSVSPSWTVGQPVVQSAVVRTPLLRGKSHGTVPSHEWNCYRQPHMGHLGCFQQKIWFKWLSRWGINYPV